MSNEITAPAQQNFFEQYGDSVTPTQIVGQLLRFSKFGDYKAGQDDQEIPLGTQLLVDMNSLRIGWVKWSDNKPVATQMGLLVEGFTPPKREDLGDMDKEMWETFDDGREKDPWQFTNQVVMMEPESGELYTFVTASKGGLGAIGEVAKAFGKRIRMSPGEVPLIELQMRKYTHATYGEIRVPKFIIADWVSPPQELLAASSGETVEEEAGAHETPPPRKRVAAPAAKPTGKPAKQAAPAAPPRGKDSISERAKAARPGANNKAPTGRPMKDVTPPTKKPASQGRARF